MMRLRRASVMAALSLPTLAETASAECAWVLWSNVILPSGEKAWSLVAAYTQQDGGKAACEKAMKSGNKSTDNGSVPQRTIMALLGHRDPRMTLRYQHLSPAHLRDAVRALDQATTKTTPELGNA